MFSDWFRPKTVILMAVVFLALAGMLLWQSQDEGGEPAPDESPQISRIRVRREGQLLDLSQRIRLTNEELRQLMKSRIHLLASGALNERRAMALQLAHMTADPAERERLRDLGPDLLQELREALFAGLADEDTIVAANCRDALIGLWRMCRSVAAAEYFSQGLAAFEAGQFDRALATFQSVERLTGSAPPDLYRMTAEIYLARQEFDKALEECRKAILADPKSFPALFVLARVYRAQGNDEKALKALEGALMIYPHYPEAEKLRQEILASEASPDAS